MLITVLSLTVAESSITGDVETVAVIAAAAVKGVIILLWFMGAGSFPRAWRVFFGMWLLVNVSVIIGFHFIGQS